MNKERARKVWDFLNMLQDYYEYGFHSDHEPIPVSKPGEAGPGGSGLQTLTEEVLECVKCSLSETRHSAVPGVGVTEPDVMVIGEGPGADEDRQGLPFVGKAGQFLDKWLNAVDLSRDKNVYIANIVKCRPPGNRDPNPAEIDACIPYLHRQIFLIKPAIIMTLGRIASQVLLGTETGIGRLRGKAHDYQGIPLIPTYHPSAVLRNPDLKREVWEDLKLMRKILDEQ